MINQPDSQNINQIQLFVSGADFPFLPLTFSMMTSYADIRSLATKRRVLSSTANKSRTLPDATLGSFSWTSIVVIASDILTVGSVSERSEVLRLIRPARLGTEYFLCLHDARVGLALRGSAGQSRNNHREKAVNAKELRTP